MTAKKYPQFLISLIIILLINVIFSIKYFSRYTDWVWLGTVVMTAFYAYLALNPMFLKSRWSDKIGWFSFGLYALLSGFVVSKIPMESLNVDRWSVITSFWDAYFSGKYAYAARSHKGSYPGPMPFYFIYSLPFYFLREFAYLSLLGIGLFIFLVKKIKNSAHLPLFIALFLFTSPVFMWETISRSAIFLNATLILAFLIYLRSCDFRHVKTLIWVGILGGLLLSTRNVFALCFVLAFGFYLKEKRLSLRGAVLLGGVVVLSFCTTFMPFIWGFWSEFAKMNPFLIQSTYLLPPQYSALFFALSGIGVLFLRREQDIIFASAILLWLTILIYALYTIVYCGFEQAYFGSKIDVSYFIFCLPFALYYLADTQENVAKQDV